MYVREAPGESWHDATVLLVTRRASPAPASVPPHVFLSMDIWVSLQPNGRWGINGYESWSVGRFRKRLQN